MASLFVSRCRTLYLEGVFGTGPVTRTRFVSNPGGGGGGHAAVNAVYLNQPLFMKADGRTAAATWRRKSTCT